jgi:hypothetical protein
MEAVSTAPRSAALKLAESIDWGIVSTWMLGFGLVVYLGLEGGGYDPLVHDQVGLAAWWTVIALVGIGALPRRRAGIPALISLGLLAALVGWTALSLAWTESMEKTSIDLARIGTYLAVFALAVLSHDRKGTRRTVGAVGAAIAFLALIALLSRLHPNWFPSANGAAKFLTGSQERLSYPLNYWNGLAALIAIGLPLVLQIATSAKLGVFRCLAAAALPAMALAIFLTLSRSGIAGAVIGLAVFLAFVPDRLSKLPTILAVAAGGTILIIAVTQRDALQLGLLTPAARDQGDEMLAMTAIVCFGVGLIQAGSDLLLPSPRLRRPRLRLSTRQSASAAGLALIALIAAVVAIGAPARASDAWNEFKSTEGPEPGTSRLSSASGESRYNFWSAAVKEQQTRPLAGTGSGTFEYWWARNRDSDFVVRDAHSLYFQTLGELGIIGFALLAAFLATILVIGARATIRSSRLNRPQIAAALAGFVAFCFVAAFDWVWQIAVLPAAVLLLGAALVGAGHRPGGPRRRPFPLWVRGGVVVIGLAMIVAIATPLSSITLVRESQADARAADLASALSAARTAQNAQPYAASPRIQEALLFESAGDLKAARVAALAATEREETNWRHWLVLSRIEAAQGLAHASLHHYRRAKSLNPRSPLFGP